MTTLLRSISISTLLACSSVASGGWEQLAPLPDKLGVAAPFAGVSGKTLLVAGGANFPDKAPWDGGKKAWYDTTYALDEKAGAWKQAGKLPHALAYGVSVSFDKRMVCVGGSDADRCYAEAFWLNYDNGQIHTNGLPALPLTLSNACGACVGNVLYIAGGQTTNDAVKAIGSVFSLDLLKVNASWKELPPIPGPGRILATAAAFQDGFYVFGGSALSEGKDHQPQRQYLSDAYRYSPDMGWTRLKDLPNPIVAAPSPAPTNATGIFILGGDDGSHVGFKPVNLHPGFSKTILRFDPLAGTWTTAGETPAARVTVPCVAWDGGWVISSGEMRPGVRSAQVWMFRPEESR